MTAVINDNTLVHYGIKGMRWGIRRTPEELGHKPTKSEKKERKSLTKDVAASQQNLKLRGRMNDETEQAARAAESDYNKQLSKIVMPWNRKAKEKSIEESGKRLEEATKKNEDTRAQLERALKYQNVNKEKLEKYVDELTDKYGEENVKQLKTKNISIGQSWVATNAIKTGIRVENLPFIGQWATGNKVAKWEKQDREELMKKRADTKAANRYY